MDEQYTDQYDHNLDDAGTEFYSRRYEFKETYDKDGFLSNIEAHELKGQDLAEGLEALFGDGSDYENREGADGETDSRTEISWDQETTEEAPDDLWYERRDDEFNHAGSSLDPHGFGMYHTAQVTSDINRARRIRGKRLDAGNGKISSIKRREYRNTPIAKHNQRVSRIASELREKGLPLPATIEAWDQLLDERAHRAAERRLSADLRRFIEHELGCTERTAYRTLKEIKNAEGDWVKDEIFSQLIQSYGLWRNEQPQNKGHEPESGGRDAAPRFSQLQQRCLYHSLVRGHFFFAHRLRQVEQPLPEYVKNRPVDFRHW